MSLISRYEHLNKKPHHEQAEQLLLKVSSLVKPIMQSHNWKVGTLAEMFPDNPSLLGLNVNKGSKILLRLRPHQAPDTFYEVEQLVLVMLHELTHNVHSPHDASFYKLLGELEEEWYALKRKGYSGEGFHSNGARLGGSHSVPEHIGRIKALEAAEKRRVKSTLMGKGGRLGGAAVVGGGARKSPREMAVEAAERRLRDESSCSHDSPSAVAEAAKAAAQSMGRDAVDLTASDGSSDSYSDDGDDGNEGKVSDARNLEEQVVIDLVSDEETSTSGADISEKKSRKRIFPPALADTESKARIVPTTEHDATLSVKQPTAPSPTVSKPGRAGPSSAAPAPPRSTTKRSTSTPSNDPPPATTLQRAYLHADGSWTCHACTLNNVPAADRCAACEGLKPIDEAVGWRCDFCYGYGNEHGRWMCLNCGAIRKRG